MSRSPYQPALPKLFLKNSTIKPISCGYPPPSAKKKVKANIEEQKAEEVLKELGVSKTAVSFLNLLKDPEKLDEVVRKLKMQMFW